MQNEIEVKIIKRINKIYYNRYNIDDCIEHINVMLSIVKMNNELREAYNNTLDSIKARGVPL